MLAFYISIQCFKGAGNHLCAAWQERLIFQVSSSEQCNSPPHFPLFIFLFFWHHQQWSGLTPGRARGMNLGRPCAGQGPTPLSICRRGLSSGLPYSDLRGDQGLTATMLMLCKIAVGGPHLQVLRPLRGDSFFTQLLIRG